MRVEREEGFHRLGCLGAHCGHAVACSASGTNKCMEEQQEEGYKMDERRRLAASHLQSPSELSEMWAIRTGIVVRSIDG